MGRLIAFLLNHRSVVIFILLQALALWLLVEYNHRPNVFFLNSSNQMVASLNASSQEFSDYFELKNVNQQLLNENKELRERLLEKYVHDTIIRDTTVHINLISAEVIDNSFRRSQNYFTISKGKNDGIEVGMGVVSKSGVAGQVKAVSNNFATVYSLLHPKLAISSKIKRTGTVCTTQWDQESFLSTSLKYVPRHVPIQLGDTVVTSGYNSVFPEGILIGTISAFDLKDFMTFYDGDVALSTDFSALHYVYVVEHTFKHEIDSLEAL